MTEFFGLPAFKRMYGFGDVATLRADMLVAFVGGADARALAGAVPAHRLLKPIASAPLVVVQTAFTSAADNGDPEDNVYRYNEVMLAVVVEGVGTPVPALFPLILFVDHPVPMVSGREYYGFPKVLGEVALERGSAAVRYAYSPRGERKVVTVLKSRWDTRPGLVARALSGLAEALAGVVRGAGVDEDTIDLVGAIALAPAGQILNVRQLPDLSNPRRARVSELTRFAPRLVDPGAPALVRGHSLELPNEPVWSLERRFFRGAPPRTLAAFTWSVTMQVTTGEVLDTW
ncbi:MAG: acetoacetate decarboxylase family protein [Labilithrix sp.]|nr:acetoacetate decarboxylase family protein [Labilithrix sp.]MCW5834551.1 acetoacetate decarboxylase family protein [Labilithrix sp.]